ncbi:MAG: alpha/beta hydrolase [Deltaproteobacteria bacterium]|nr:alpha/beta hydrolase [Deltaproteobacteria bacterium]
MSTNQDRHPAFAKKLANTPMGRIAYLEAGAADAPAVLFVHGIPTSGALWRHVMRALEGRFRCIAPDLMGLGDTVVDPRADLSMPAQAEMLLELLDALGVRRAHVVAHDQGGAAGQILAVRHGHRVDRLVLTDCVCYDNWPVPVIRRLQLFSRVPLLPDLAASTGLIELLEARTRLSAFRRGYQDPGRIDRGIVAEYLRPLRAGSVERERFLAFLRAGSPRHTMAVARGLKEIACPTLILWAQGDRYIPTSWARRLHGDIPGARLEIVPGAGHFWPDELPGPFADRIGEFFDAPLVDEPSERAARKSLKCSMPRTREEEVCS